MYALVNDLTDIVEGQSGEFSLDDMGLPVPPPPTLPGYAAHPLTQPLPWASRPSDAYQLKWNGGESVWVEVVPLVDMQASAIAQTYVDVDAVYAAAVGNRTPEYTEAEAAARAYLAVDPKPAVVSEFITDHAQDNPTGDVQTNDWAAQQIVEKADVLKWAVRQMRKVRFARQADMRAAATPQELAVAVQAWNDFITWLRSTLRL
jgi:hypothetical protein